MVASECRLGSKAKDSAANSTVAVTLFFSITLTDLAIAWIFFLVSSSAGKLPLIKKISPVFLRQRLPDQRVVIRHAAFIFNPMAACTGRMYWPNVRAECTGRRAVQGQHQPCLVMTLRIISVLRLDSPIPPAAHRPSGNRPGIARSPHQSGSDWAWRSRHTP